MLESVHGWFEIGYHSDGDHLVPRRPIGHPFRYFKIALN